MNIYSYHLNKMSFAGLSLRTIKFLIFRIYEMRRWNFSLKLFVESPSLQN